MNNFIEWAKSTKGIIILTLAAVVLLYVILRRKTQQVDAAAASGDTSGSGVTVLSPTQPGSGTDNGPQNPSGDGAHDGQPPIATGGPGIVPPSSAQNYVAVIRAKQGAGDGDGTNVRATPGGTIIGYVAWGSTIPLIDQTPVSGPAGQSGTGSNSNWYKVSYGGIPAYINAGNVASVQSA